MHCLFILFTVLLFSMTTLGQKSKLPPEGSYRIISNPPCNYPRQVGRLEIVRNDTSKLTTYRTDSSAMIMYAGHFVGFLAGWGDKDSAQKIYTRLDTLVSLLFRNGLLTSDLLAKAISAEIKVIDHRGDTLDWTRGVRAETVKILNIKRKDLPKDHKDKKGAMLFEVWATFDIYESGWGSFPMFDLYLKADMDPTPTNLAEYLTRAKIQCLRYTETQF